MKKGLFLLFFITNILSANLYDKIENFMGKEEFLKQENLIKILFKNESDFYREDDGNVDSIKVIEILKESGLFKLFYSTPVSLRVEFVTDKNPLIFMKIINDSLESIGYNYFLTESAKKDDKGFIWVVTLKTRHLVNPLIFAKELEKRGCLIKDIVKKDNYFWSYSIDSTDAKLNALSIDSDTTVKLKKPIEPYLLYSKSDFETITIKSSFSDHWYPFIVFLDKSLHVISYRKTDERTYSMKLDIPKDCVYIKIGDLYTLDNIKHGLSVYINTIQD